VLGNKTGRGLVEGRGLLLGGWLDVSPLVGSNGFRLHHLPFLGFIFLSLLCFFFPLQNIFLISF